jgi:hypothetical protein
MRLSALSSGTDLIAAVSDIDRLSNRVASQNNPGPWNFVIKYGDRVVVATTLEKSIGYKSLTESSMEMDSWSGVVDRSYLH